MFIFILLGVPVTLLTILTLPFTWPWNAIGPVVAATYVCFGLHFLSTRGLLRKPAVVSREVCIAGTPCMECGSGLVIHTCDNPACGESWLGSRAMMALDERHKAKKCPPGACSRCLFESPSDYISPQYMLRRILDYRLEGVVPDADMLKIYQLAFGDAQGKLGWEQRRAEQHRESCKACALHDRGELADIIKYGNVTPHTCGK